MSRVEGTLFSISSAAAKGRGSSGGSGGGNGISVDDWDAPPALKAIMAFYIIFAIAFIGLLVLTIQRMGRLPNFAARAPFIMAAAVLFVLILAYILSAVATRVSSDIPYNTYYGIWGAINFFLAVEVGFRPAAVLLLAQQRGKLLRNAQRKAMSPIASQFWKRILDWSLVAIGCLIYLTYMAIVVNRAMNIDSLDSSAYKRYRDALLGFSHMITVMIILLAVDVFVTLLLLYMSGRRLRCSDPVIGRVLAIAGPAFLIFALESLVFDIYYSIPTTFSGYSYLGAEVAQVLLDGICRIVIFATLISVMTIPPVQWTAAPIAASGYGPPPPSMVYPGQPQGWQYQPQPYANPSMPAPYQYQQQYPQQYPQQQPYAIPTGIQTSIMPPQPQHPPS